MTARHNCSYNPGTYEYPLLKLNRAETPKINKIWTIQLTLHIQTCSRKTFYSFSEFEHPYKTTSERLQHPRTACKHNYHRTGTPERRNALWAW